MVTLTMSWGSAIILVLTVAAAITIVLGKVLCWCTVPEEERGKF